MGRLIALKVDVSKIDKTRLFQGAKGTYLDLTVSINDQQDNYGNDVSCWQGQTKEEREAKTNRNFLGNGKTVYNSDQQPQQSQSFGQPQQDNRNTQFDQTPPPAPMGLPVEDELPF